jgi:hypothetical protein
MLKMITNYLVVGGINAGRVVRASMKDDNGTLGRSLQIFDHAVKVKACGGLVPVTVFPDLLEA